MLLLADSREAAAEVDRLRRYWKPKRVRVVLLAESHKQTTKEQYQHLTSLQVVRQLSISRKHYPRHYVKFVYCLAYGENELLEKPLAGNRGTPPFWKILFHCCNDLLHLNNDSSRGWNHNVILKGNTSFHQRLAVKINLLERLRKTGIWLVDASTVGIAKLDSKDKERIISDSWRRATFPLLQSLCELEKIVVIGKGVEGVVRDDLGTLRERGVKWISIPQPEGVRSGPGSYDEHYRTLYRTCRTYCQPQP